MCSIIIKSVLTEEIPMWLALSNEYDPYVMKLVPDLTQWYEGNESDMAFSDYMRAKIEKNEAFMAFEKIEKRCLGIVGFSRRNNRITFLGVSHSADFCLVGGLLINYALKELNNNENITINVLKSEEKQIERERELVRQFGFTYLKSDLENGVPVDTMIRQP